MQKSKKIEFSQYIHSKKSREWKKILKASRKYDSQLDVSNQGDNSYASALTPGLEHNSLKYRNSQGLERRPQSKNDLIPYRRLAGGGDSGFKSFFD